MGKRWMLALLILGISLFMTLGVAVYAEEDDITSHDVPDTLYEYEAVPAAKQVNVMPGTPAPVVPASAPTVPGVVEISGFNYPVYLYTPKDYRTDRTYSLIVMAPAELIDAQAQMEYLSGLASRKNIFILSTHSLWPKRGSTPYMLDDWLLNVKRQVAQMYPINRNHIYLLGKGEGAEYAAYLGTKYPGDFSGVALLGEAWDGLFSQLIHPSPDISNQVPFYVALKAGTDAKARNQAWFDDFQKKGYLIHLVEYQKDEDLLSLDFKMSIYDWLETASQNWAAAQAKENQGWKGKFKKGVKDFFAV